MEKVLYVEDMKKGYELTKDVLGSNVRVCWIKKITSPFDRIAEHIEKYDRAIIDVNLNALQPETEEGLNVIKKLREISQILK